MVEQTVQYSKWSLLDNHMNIDLRLSLTVFGYWIEVQLFEIDWDSQWGICLGILKFRYSNTGDRSLFQFVDTKTRTSLRLFFINFMDVEK